MKKNRGICLVMVLLLLIASLAPTVSATQENQSVVNGCHSVNASKSLAESKKLLDTSKAVILYERNSDTMVYTWNADGKIYPSSMVKLMTALVAIENGELSNKVTVTRRALSYVSIGAVSAGLVAGEELTLQDLLYCMMAASANDASVVIAEHIAGSQEGFWQLMNEKAVALGCTGTHFSNAHGLHEEQTYTTARDICRIVDAALENETFRQLFDAKRYTVPATNKSEAREIFTSNYMMSKDVDKRYFDDRVTGGKTGATDQAGRCLVLTAEKDGMELLGIVMGAQATYEEDRLSLKTFGSFEEMKILLDYGFRNFEYRQVFSDQQTVTQYPVIGGANHVVTRPAESLATVLPRNMEAEKIKWVYGDVAGTLSAPVTQGQLISNIQVWYGNICLAQTDLIAFRGVGKYEAPPEPGSQKPIDTDGGSWTVLLIVLGVIFGAALLVLLVVLSVKGVKKLLRKNQLRRRRINRRRKH